jgi:hypothetical protein
MSLRTGWHGLAVICVVIGYGTDVFQINTGVSWYEFSIAAGVLALVNTRHADPVSVTTNTPRGD